MNAIPAAHPRRSSFSIDVNGRARRGSICSPVRGGYRNAPFNTRDLFIFPALARRSELPPPTLPGPPEGDPEGEEDQLEIQPETLATDVEPIIRELVAPRDVSWGEDLRDPGKPGPDPEPLRNAALE